MSKWDDEQRENLRLIAEGKLRADAVHYKVAPPIGCDESHLIRSNHVDDCAACRSQLREERESNEVDRLYLELRKAQERYDAKTNAPIEAGASRTAG